MISLHYAGLDVHKETIDVFVYREGDQRVLREKSIPNRVTSLRIHGERRKDRQIG